MGWCPQPDQLSGTSYTYGDITHKHAVSAAYGNSYGYDGNGNQTSRTIAGTTYSFVFDYENRLTEVKQGSTTLATFLYDANGNRVKGTVGGVTTVYIAGIYERQGAAASSYYEGGGLRRSGYSSNNGVFYMLSDHLKSTAALVARNGVLNVKYFYYPYGARRGVPFNSITAKRFTGQYHEASLPGGEGLSFYNARWYDPKLGSFLSADSIVPAPLAPQSLNRYAYAGGNPLRFSDPSGHMKLCGAACEDEYKWSPVKTVGGSSGSTGGGTYGGGASVGRGTISYRHPAAGDYGLASYKMSQQPTRSVTASTVTQHPLYGTARLALGNMVYLEEGPGGSWRSRTAAAYVAWNTAGYDILVLLNNELRPGRYAYQGPWMPEGADPEIWNDILGIVADVLKRRAPDETNGAKYFANIVNTPGEVTRYEDTLAYWVQTNLDANLSRGEALARAGYGLIPRGFGSPYVFVLNRATSVPVPAYRVPDDQYHAPLDVKLD